MNSRRHTIDVPDLLKKHGLKPNKKLGQNFLVDEAHLRAIVTKAELAPSDTVLEIGAGLGSLTAHLAETVERVIAVEMDRQLVPILKDNLAAFPNAQLIQGDIFDQDMKALLPDSGYQVVANIPYYLTSKLIRHLLEAERKPRGLTLTIQKEVAERACELPPKMSLLALGIRVYGKPEIVHAIPAGAFYPVPKVDSAVLKIELFEQAALNDEQREMLFRMARAAFGQKRKTLANSLAALPDWDKDSARMRLERAGIQPTQRPQTLALEDWKRLIVRVARDSENATRSPRLGERRIS